MMPPAFYAAADFHIYFRGFHIDRLSLLRIEYTQLHARYSQLHATSFLMNGQAGFGFHAISGQPRRFEISQAATGGRDFLQVMPSHTAAISIADYATMREATQLRRQSQPY